MFTFDVNIYRNELSDKGYVRIRNAVSDDFQEYLSQFYQQSWRTGHNEHEDGYIEGKKRQFVFDFPDDEAALEFREKVSALTGLGREKFTISERHIKAYDHSAKHYPAPHKDRNASTYSLGIPIYLAPGTSVCVFPELGRTLNTSDTAIFMAAEKETDFEYLYRSENAVLIQEEMKDMIVFEGSALFHERMKPAGTAILYLKVNDTGLDPLQENLQVFGRPPVSRAVCVDTTGRHFPAGPAFGSSYVGKGFKGTKKTRFGTGWPELILVVNRPPCPLPGSGPS